MYRMGSERRVEPGTENKLKMSVPGPTRYQLPSLVGFLFIIEIFRSKKVPELPSAQE
jgi:hypothetical protein